MYDLNKIRQCQNGSCIICVSTYPFDLEMLWEFLNETVHERVCLPLQLCIVCVPEELLGINEKLNSSSNTLGIPYQLYCTHPYFISHPYCLVFPFFTNFSCSILLAALSSSCTDWTFFSMMRNPHHDYRFCLHDMAELKKCIKYTTNTLNFLWGI